MGAKKIKKRRFTPDIPRVNRALRAITTYPSSEVPISVAPIPIWQLTRPLPGPGEPDAPIPAIRPELVDPVIIITDPYVVEDFEKTGLSMARIDDPDCEKVLFWMIDKSRDLDRRNIDAEFAIDMGREFNSRTMGPTLAELAAKGFLRIVATGDASKVIVQMIYTPEDYARSREEIEADYRRFFPSRAQ